MFFHRKGRALWCRNRSQSCFRQPGDPWLVRQLAIGGDSEKLVYRSMGVVHHVVEQSACSLVYHNISDSSIFLDPLWRAFQLSSKCLTLVSMTIERVWCTNRKIERAKHLPSIIKFPAALTRI